MANFILGIFMIVASAVSFIDAARLTEALRKMRSLEPIGPDRYLAGVAALIGVLGVILVLQSFRKLRVPAATEKLFTLSEPHVLLIGVLLLYVLALYFLGYPLSTLAFFLAAFPIMGFASRRWLIPSAIVATAGFYVIFVRIADIPLPAGIWARF